MKAEKSIISFPFVIDTKENSNLSLIHPDEYMTLLESIVQVLLEEKKDLYNYFKFAIEGQLIDDLRKKEIFKSLDYESTESFINSLTSICGANYLVYISGWHKIQTDLIQRMVKYLKSALNLDDELIANSDFELFIGKYQKTYGGIHRAECSNLQYVLYGEKWFSYWHPDENMGDGVRSKIDEFSNGREEYLETEPANISDNEIILHGSQGHVFNIPHSWWHVGSSPNSSIAITIAIYHK